jgi:acetolactate synthase-1/2/3 large subunit
VALEGDARAVLAALLEALGEVGAAQARTATVAARIARDKQAYLDEWLAHDSKGRVNPARFFQALRRQLPADALLAADDGNHTFLVAELMQFRAPRSYFSPSDFNSMGYCVPGVIGAKLARPDRVVVGIVGDGGFLFSATELATAVQHGIAVVIVVFDDGAFGNVKRIQTERFGAERTIASTLVNPDFVTFDLHAPSIAPLASQFTATRESGGRDSNALCLSINKRH